MHINYSSFEQGDIVVANIAYSDFSEIKRRPVLVISSTEFNSNSGNIIALNISSSKIKSKYDSALFNKDLTEGELLLESKIMADFPTTLSKNLVSQKIAKVSEKKLEEVKEKIRELYLI